MSDDYQPLSDQSLMSEAVELYRTLLGHAQPLANDEVWARSFAEEEQQIALNDLALFETYRDDFAAARQVRDEAFAWITRWLTPIADGQPPADPPAVRSVNEQFVHVGDLKPDALAGLVLPAADLRVGDFKAVHLAVDRSHRERSPDRSPPSSRGSSQNRFGGQRAR